MKKIDMAGLKYGKLTVMPKTIKKGKDLFWLCRCDCGNEVYVRGYSLRNGDTQSCGCYRIEKLVDASHNRKKYAAPCNSKTNRLYRIYGSMKSRCNDLSNKTYGGKGIGICPEWNNYGAFHEWAIKSGYSDNLTIDRIDNSKGYSPDNCRWANRAEQANNMTSNRQIVYKGQTKNLCQWATELGMDHRTLSYRIDNGWDVEEAFYTPVGIGGENKKRKEIV